MSNFRSNDKDGEGVFWSDSTPQADRDAYPRKDELNFVRMLNGVLPREIRITACVVNFFLWNSTKNWKFPIFGKKAVLISFKQIWYFEHSNRIRFPVSLTWNLIKINFSAGPRFPSTFPLVTLVRVEPTSTPSPGRFGPWTLRQCKGPATYSLAPTTFAILPWWEFNWV